MKRLTLFLLAVVAAGSLVSGCSEDNPVAPPNPAQLDGSIFQRPDFIDTRPPEVKLQYTWTEREATPVEPGNKAAGKYALVIGISDYAGTVNDLNYCDDDARDWAQRLQSEGYSVNSLIDRAATASAIQAAVNALVANSVAGSSIAFCYSGHGYKGNMISTDMYYISASWLGSKFSTAASTKMAFAFDACQIGSFGSALKKTGRVIALASGTSNYSYDGDATMKNGVFTYYQMLGFDQMGYVYYEPDCAYAVQGMKVWASQYRGIRVTPSYIDSYAGNLDL